MAGIAIVPSALILTPVKPPLFVKLTSVLADVGVVPFEDLSFAKTLDVLVPGVTVPKTSLTAVVQLFTCMVTGLEAAELQLPVATT